MSATISMDKAGRLVLPKSVREQMSLHAGSKLKVEIVGDKIELSQEVPEVKIRRTKGGLPVVDGWVGFDAAKAVREMREDQVRRLSSARRK